MHRFLAATIDRRPWPVSNLRRFSLTIICKMSSYRCLAKVLSLQKVLRTSIWLLSARRGVEDDFSKKYSYPNQITQATPPLKTSKVDPYGPWNTLFRYIKSLLRLKEHNLYKQKYSQLLSVYEKSKIVFYLTRLRTKEIKQQVSYWENKIYTCQG